MPFELIVGYITDMKSPDSGRQEDGPVHAADDRERKQSRMLPLNTASTACQRNCCSIQAPRKRPAARSRKNTDTL